MKGLDLPPHSTFSLGTVADVSQMIINQAIDINWVIEFCEISKLDGDD